MGECGLLSQKTNRARRGSGCPLCSEEEENRVWITVPAHSEQAPCLRVPGSSALKGLHRLTQASVPPPWINVRMLDLTSGYCQDRMLRGALLQGGRIGIR